MRLICYWLQFLYSPQNCKMRPMLNFLNFFSMFVKHISHDFHFIMFWSKFKYCKISLTLFYHIKIFFHSYFSYPYIVLQSNVFLFYKYHILFVSNEDGLKMSLCSMYHTCFLLCQLFYTFMLNLLFYAVDFKWLVILGCLLPQIKKSRQINILNYCGLFYKFIFTKQTSLLHRL